MINILALSWGWGLHKDQRVIRYHPLVPSFLHKDTPIR